MVTDHLCAVSWRARPGSFVSLMTLYESNYIRLGWILPDARALQGRHVSLVPGDVNLHLEVTEQDPYTTMLNLSHVLGDASQAVITPDLQIRVYHDARLAEARACTGSPGPRALRAMRAALSRTLDQRWSRNVLLNKWLEYCAERGHRFSGSTSVAAAPA